MVTYNQIVKAFRDISTAHYQINSFGIGDIAEIAASGVIDYPMCWAIPNDSNITDNGKVYQSNFTLIFMDLVLNGEANEDEVLSDMELVAIDYIAQLQNNNYDFDFKSDGITFRRFTERFDDMVAGVAIDISIRVPITYDRCAIPSSIIQTGGGGGGTGNCLPVNIINQLSQVIATVQSGGTYQVIQVSGIDGGASNTNYTNSIIQA